MLKSSSQISRNGHKVLPSVIVLYILFQIFVTTNTECNSNNSVEQSTLSSSTREYYLCAGFAFSVSAMQHLTKAIYYQNTDSTSSHKNFMLHMAAVTISMIAGSSSLLTYVYDYGTCQANKGNANQWSKWIVCTPLLAYIVISGENKEYLSFLDKILIISLFVVVLCMMFNHLTFTDYASDQILNILCCLLVIISALLALIKAFKLWNKSMSFFMSAVNNSLLKLTWGILPCLLILFLFGFFNVINRNFIQIGHVLLNVITNLLFLNFLVDEQIHVALKTTFLQEAEILANLERQRFLR
jgi:uncharacterized membrane protein YbjE (DUF340 family)